MLIPHRSPLLEGRLLARYDRFIVAVALDNRVVEAHCVNPGRMEGLVKPGVRAWLSQAPDDRPRKLRFTLELLETKDCLVGANTQTPNELAERLVLSRAVDGLKRFTSLRREVRYGSNSRIDMLLESPGHRHYVEVKNCHLVYPDHCAYFPDSVSARATDHLRELTRVVTNHSDRATVLFVVQRRDAERVRPSQLHDPAFAAAARDARSAGVRFRAVQVEPRLDGFLFCGMLPVDFRPQSLTRMMKYRSRLLPDSGWTRRGETRLTGFAVWPGPRNPATVTPC